MFCSCFIVNFIDFFFCNNSYDCVHSQPLLKTAFRLIEGGIYPVIEYNEIQPTNELTN